MLMGFVTNVSAQMNLVIKGTVKGDTKGFNKVYLFGEKMKEDSVEIKEGAFTFNVPWVAGAVPYIYSEYDAETIAGPTSFPIVIDGPGTVHLKVDDITKGLISAKISGNASAAAFQSFDEGNRKMDTEIKAKLSELFPGKGKEDMAWRKAYTEQRRARMFPYIHQFVEANSNSYVSAFVLHRYLNILPTEDLEKLFSKLSPALQAVVPGKAVGDHLSGLKLAAIGNYVQDFTLSTPKGDSIAFNSLKGKYVLIDFWSSWCGPCKASFPHMKEVYQKYRGDQFEIIGISIDEEKAAWLKELDKQQLPWLQVLDTKKVYVSGFGVTGVPTAFLISPDGKIMMKEIGFDKNGNGEIEKRLKELFGK